MMVSGEVIRNLREEKGLTQDKLGALIGAGGNLVSRWEREKSVPGSYYLQKLSEFFEKPIDYFMKGVSSHVKERSVIENLGTLVFELDSQRLEVPATSDFAEQFWERVDRMIELGISRKESIREEN